VLLVGKFNSHCSFAENPILPTPINVNGRRLKFRLRDNRRCEIERRASSGRLWCVLLSGLEVHIDFRSGQKLT
jgi:hypothetical protein